MRSQASRLQVQPRQVLEVQRQHGRHWFVRRHQPLVELLGLSGNDMDRLVLRGSQQPHRAVPEGVHPGPLFALGGAWAGGFLRIGAVCGDLPVGSPSHRKRASRTRCRLARSGVTARRVAGLSVVFRRTFTAGGPCRRLQAFGAIGFCFQDHIAPQESDFRRRIRVESRPV